MPASSKEEKEGASSPDSGATVQVAESEPQRFVEEIQEEAGMCRVRRTYRRIFTLKEGEELPEGSIAKPYTGKEPDHGYKLIKEDKPSTAAVMTAEDRLIHTVQEG